MLMDRASLGQSGGGAEQGEEEEKLGHQSCWPSIPRASLFLPRIWDSPATNVLSS